MHRLAAVLIIVALSLMPASLAQAQLGGPNVPNQLTEPPPPPAQPAQKFEDEGLSGFQKLLIFGAAAVVLGLIAFVIVRDARQAAPVERPGGRSSGGGGGSGGGGKGGDAGKASGPQTSAERARERQRAKREKAKARNVRQQRKRNRPR